MAQNLINIDRDTPMLLPPDMRDWLPEDHMVHFILDVVHQVDTSLFSINARGSGSAQYPPSMLLALLVYCYATGRFSYRVIEEASWCDVAVRYICADTHPDHDTICTFRRVNRRAFEKFFVHVLEVAQQSGVLKKVGTVSVDGTKIHANASKHSALSHGHATELLKQLENEVSILTQKAEEADTSKPEGCTVNLPDEISRREDRQSRIREAVAVIEARHAEELSAKKAAYEAKVAEREAARRAGRKPRGREPKAPPEAVDPKDQYNFTDPQSRIMKAGNGQHFDQCYNAQAALEVDSMLIISNHLSDQPNDKGERLRALDAVRQNGFTVDKALADTGYYSEANTARCIERGIDPYITVSKQNHGRSLESILGEESVPDLPANASAKERMAHKLKDKEAAKLYALRKQTVEPVFGIIKHCMRFRQFLMRCKENVSGEWNLVCTAYNLKRTFNLIGAAGAAACPEESTAMA